MNSIDLVLGISLLLGGAAISDDAYIDVGYAVHPKSFDSPEVSLGTSIFEVETGIEFGKKKIFFRHNSGLFDVEEGGGFNLIGFKYRIK